jgi:acyl carrier protein
LQTVFRRKAQGGKAVSDIGAVFRDILVRHLNADGKNLAAEVRLVEDLGADSIALFEMVVACEEEFCIDIPNEALAKFVTVGDALAFIEAKANDAKAGSLHADTVFTGWRTE